MIRIFLFLILFSSSSAFSEVSSEILTSCHVRYTKEWENTQGILAKLKIWGDSCWDSQQRQDMANLKSKIKIDLENLSSELGSNELDRAQDQLHLLIADYQKIQNYLSYCRAHEILRPSSEVSPLESTPFAQSTMEDRVLVHILGDIFASRTGLEGFDNREAQHLDIRRIYLEKIQSELAERTYIKDQSQADPCFDLPKVTRPSHGSVPLADFSQADLKSLIAKERAAKELTSAFFESLAVFLKTMRTQIDMRLLAEDDALYFQTGWIGHAVIMEFRRQSNGLYSIRVYNSGSGLSSHHTSLKGTEESYFPFVENMNLSYEALFNPLALKALRDLSVQEDKDKSVNSMPHYLYKILELWGGERVTREVALEDFLDPQMSGTCAYYSIPYYHKSNAKDKKKADTLEFFIRFQYLDFYIQKNRLRMQSVRSSHLIVEKSITYLMQEVAALHGEGSSYLDAGVEVIAAEKLKLYQHVLGRQHKETSSEQRITDYSVCDGYPEDACLGGGGFPLISHSKFIYPEVEEDLSTLEIFNADHWVPRRESLIQDMKDFIKNFSNKQYAQRIQFIKMVQDIAHKLPLKRDFWEDFTQDELQSILALLRKMSADYLWCFFENVYASWTAHRGLTVVEYLAQVKLLSVADLMMSVYSIRDPFFEGEFPSLYQNLFDDYLYGSSVSLSLKDLAWASSLGDMRTYWEHRKNKGISFFAFEKFPVRGGSQSERNLFKSEKEAKNAPKHWSNG